MTSSFGWLDHSEHQRRQMLEIVDLFREKGTLDELGIGVIRDALADHFFPGTSTLQTRARYLLFIPWIFLGLEHTQTRSNVFDARARADQARLVQSLVRGGESVGVIGITARETILRPPSELYWTALRVLGIFRYSGTFGAYLASRDAHYRADRTLLKSDDGEILEAAPSAWHSGLPPAPSDLWERATFRLTRAEAEYLRERIVSEQRDSLYAAYVVDDARLDPVAAPWDHPARNGLPDQLRADLEIAELFSLVIQGAYLLYNVMLADASVEHGLAARAPRPARYRELLSQWRALMIANDERIQRWSPELLWRLMAHHGRPVALPTRRFVEEWSRIATSRGGALPDDLAARALIRDRERSLKRGLARLGNLRALENWGGESSVGRLDYRWANVKQQLQDIHAGLRRRGEDVDA
jgi:hypothetical protein